MQQQKKEKVRIFALARELSMETKDLLVLCQQHGLDVKNQLSTIEPEVRDQILQLVKRGANKPQAPAQPAVPAAPVAPPPTRKIVNLDNRPRTAPAKGEAPVAPPPAAATPAHAAVTPPVAPPAATTPARPADIQTPRPPTTPQVAPTTPPAQIIKPAAPTPPAPQAPTTGATPTEKPTIPAEKPHAPAASTPPAPKPSEAPAAATPPAKPPEPRPTPQPAPPPRPVGPMPSGNRPPMRNLGAPGSSRPVPAQGGQGGPGGGQPRTPRVPGQPRPGQFRMASGPQQRSVRPQEPAKPQQQQPTGPRKLANIDAETLAGLEGRGSNISVREIEERIRKQQQGPGAVVPGQAPAEGEVFDEDDGKKDSKGRKPAPGAGPAAAAGPGGVAGRADRHKERSERQARRKAQGGAEVRGGKVAVLDDDHPRHRKDPRRRLPKQPPTVDRIGKIPVSLPISVRSLSEAIGRKAGEVLFKLLAHGLPPTTTNINSGIDAEVAELVALEFGKEIEIKRGADAEGDLIASHETADTPEDLVPRAPIVVIMGHVDHGKTSLLDRIRETYNVKSDVVSSEAGGITQVIRAWRVEKDGKPVTFLDTPGHQAFTKMRARGANVTDIAVIVVAANDGVMPQTEEAISHAKAAEVHIVVAINKVDLPDANLRKTEQMLMSLGLIPDTMGGDVPFVHTSAKTGKGIDELLDQLSVVAELADLKANPNKHASGTCLEAHLSEKEGVQATLLVQNGTLKPGDIVLCGATYGSVRKMYDDLGRVIDSAGPSVPVRILGLDAVPNADDTFHVVPDLTTAAEIAEERKTKQREKSLRGRAPVTLENLKAAEIGELKVIVKAEARGSIEAIRNELEKLHHEEVRVRVLHTGIGGINVSDVQLALTSPSDTIVVGFNVVPDNEALQMAEERGVQLREYDIIYKLADDIRSALEGKLKPREEIVHLGRANVRDIFKISRVGTIAGCFVVQGVMDRSAKIRIIRGGVVVFPPAERTAGLESLKRFKDDVREVREGFECGLKIAGYDDIKVGDTIECYKVEQVQRTLLDS